MIAMREGTIDAAVIAVQIMGTTMVAAMTTTTSAVNLKVMAVL
jgi:hypothetical protein